MQGDAHVVVGIHVIGIAGERFDVRMRCRAVLSVGVEREAEELVSLRVLRIHAERRASLRNRVGAIVEKIEEVGQAAVVLGEVGHELRGLRDLVESIVKAPLLAEHRTQGKVQGGILGIGA